MLRMMLCVIRLPRPFSGILKNHKRLSVYQSHTITVKDHGKTQTKGRQDSEKEASKDFPVP